MSKQVTEYWRIYHKAQGDSPYVVMDRSEWETIVGLIEDLMLESADNGIEAGVWREAWEGLERSWWVRLGDKLRLLWPKKPEPSQEGSLPW